jgi:hypothetical protein
MRTTSPPRLATWMLDRLVSGPKRESLCGDLAEQYGRGRSSAWYWHQVLMVVTMSTARDIWEHKFIAARAVVISWMFLIPWVFFTGWIYGSSKWWFEDTLMRESVRFHAFWILYQAPLMIMWCLGSALIGWIIARVHSEGRAGMLFACAAAQLPWAIQWGRPIWRLANAGLPFFRSFPVVVDVGVVFIVMPLSLWLGGLAAAAPPRHGAGGSVPQQTP